MFRQLYKQYIKSSRGFTLIELMAAIAILAIILLIAVPGIGNIMENAEAKAEAASIEMIEKAGGIAHSDGLAHDAPGQYNITTLIDEGYLDLDRDDPLAAATAYVSQISENSVTYVYNGDSLEFTPESDFAFQTVEQAVVDLYAGFGTDVTWDTLPGGAAEGQQWLDMWGLNSPDDGMITGYVGDSKNIAIPHTINGHEVRMINDGAFENMDLESVILPNFIINIGSDAFSGNHFTSVELPEGLLSVKPNAFGNNANLTDVYSPRSLNMGGLAMEVDSKYFGDHPDLVLHVYEDSSAETWALHHGYTIEYR